jgi:hypothetical protein
MPKSLAFQRALGSNGPSAIYAHDSKSKSAQEARKPMSAQLPRGDRRNCANNNGIGSSRKNESTPSTRSAQGAGDQAIPSTPRLARNRGRLALGDLSSSRSVSKSRVGTVTSSQSMVRMLVADVDQGSETTTATASPSAHCNKVARSIILLNRPVVSWSSTSSPFHL